MTSAIKRPSVKTLDVDKSNYDTRSAALTTRFYTDICEEWTSALVKHPSGGAVVLSEHIGVDEWTISYLQMSTINNRYTVSRNAINESYKNGAWPIVIEFKHGDNTIACVTEIQPIKPSENKQPTETLVTSTISTQQQNRCHVCNTPSALCCTICQTTFYCGKSHQKSDWKSHKLSHATSVVESTQIVVDNVNVDETTPNVIDANAVTTISALSSAPSTPSSTTSTTTSTTASTTEIKSFIRLPILSDSNESLAFVSSKLPITHFGMEFITPTTVYGLDNHVKVMVDVNREVRKIAIPDAKCAVRCIKCGNALVKWRVNNIFVDHPTYKLRWNADHNFDVHQHCSCGYTECRLNDNAYRAISKSVIPITSCIWTVDKLVFKAFADIISPIATTPIVSTTIPAKTTTPKPHFCNYLH